VKPPSCRPALLGLVGLLAVGALAPPSAAGAQIRHERLDNGLTVIVRENPVAPVVAVSLLVKMGTRWERPATVGISNFVTFLKNTGAWRRNLRIAEYGDPEKDREFLESISPNRNAHLIESPLFIIHGTNDPRVPLGEAEQIAGTLKGLGREAHLLKFDDEGHGLIKLKNRIAGYGAAVEFLMRHVSAP